MILAREGPARRLRFQRLSPPRRPPTDARIGTSSLRRQCQLAARYPSWRIHGLRGNVNSRLAKLDAGSSTPSSWPPPAWKRLGLAERITVALTPEFSLPAIGQGAIGVECRLDDARTRT